MINVVVTYFNISKQILILHNDDRNSLLSVGRQRLLNQIFHAFYIKFYPKIHIPS